MFKNIMVAYDGSDLAEKALTMAEEMAAQNGATLHVFHVNLVSASLAAQAASSPALQSSHWHTRRDSNPRLAA